MVINRGGGRKTCDSRLAECFRHLTLFSLTWSVYFAGFTAGAFDQTGRKIISVLLHFAQQWTNCWNHAGLLCLNEDSSAPFHSEAVDLACHASRQQLIDEDQRRPSCASDCDHLTLSAAEVGPPRE